MRWPFPFRPGGSTPLPSAPAPPDRPSTVIGLFSDLSMSPKQAVTFVFVVGSIIIIASLCFVGVCFAVAAASRGMKGIPLRYIFSIGVSGASVVTLVTALVTHRFRKWAKAVQGDAADDGKQVDKQ